VTDTLTPADGDALFDAILTDTLLPGHASLPNGLGLSYPDGGGGDTVNGVAANELTDSANRDWLAGTPLHKHMPARIEAVAPAAAVEA